MEGFIMVDKAPAKKAAANRSSAAKRTANKPTTAAAASSISKDFPTVGEAGDTAEGATGTTTRTESSDQEVKQAGDVSAPSDEGTTGNPNAPEAENPNPQDLRLIHDKDAATVEGKTVDRGFKYEHNLDPARAIPGTSDYLDHRDRRSAEVQRARVEQREPDLINPPSYQGAPLTATSKLEAAIPYNVTIEPDVILPVVISGAALDADKDGVESNDNEVKSVQIDGDSYSKDDNKGNA